MECRSAGGAEEGEGGSWGRYLHACCLVAFRRAAWLLGRRKVMSWLLEMPSTRAMMTAVTDFSFWVQLSQRITLPTTSTFVLLYATYATYHLAVHVRALLMTRSFRRLESVVRSAYHNIIGYPGDSYYIDHVFAFSDTAFHLFHLGVVSVHVVGLGKSVQIIGAAVMAGMLLALIGAGFAGGNLPSDSGRSNSNRGIPSEKLSTRNTLSRRGDQPMCSCKTCVQLAGSASGTTPRATAFCIRVRGLSLSVCDLWQKTFREALSMIDDCNALAATDAKAQ